MGMAAQNDAHLLNRWQAARDAEALHELLRRYSGMVYATCLRILRNSHDAEEASQDVFITLARGANISGTYIGPWLHRVATNRCLDRLKTEQRRRERETLAAKSNDDADTVAWDDLQEFVDEAIAGLPDTYRAVVVAHFLEGRTHHAIAQECGITRQAVSRRIAKGIELIRATLRLKGVSVTALALSALLSQNAIAAAPPTLAAVLGKLALAGAQHVTTASMTATHSTGTTAILGGVLMKKTIVAAGIVLGAIAGTWYATKPEQAAPEPAPMSAMPAPEPVIPDVAPPPQPDPPAAPTTQAAAPVEPTEPQLEPGEIADSSLYASVSGAVTNIDGEPVPDAAVSIVAMGLQNNPDVERDAFALDRILSNRRHVSHAITDSSGKYTLADIRFEGDAIVAVDAAGYSIVHRQVGEIDIVPGQHIEGVDFLLEPGTSLNGIVLSPNRRPLPNAIILSTDTAAVMNSDPSGLFSVNIPMSDHPRPSFIVYHDEFGRTIFEDVEVGDATQPFELIMVGMAGLKGRITLASGAPAVQYTIQVDGSFEVDGNRTRLPTYKVETNELGEYAFDALESANYFARIVAPDDTPASAVIDLGLLESGHTRTWDYVIPDAMTVRGIVRGKSTHKPMPGKTVVWANEGKVIAKATTDQNGVYALQTFTSPGTHVIAPVGAPSLPNNELIDQWMLYAKDLQIVPGKEMTIDLTLPDTFTATAVFLDSNNNPVTDGIRVVASMHDEAGGSSYSQRLSPNKNGGYTWNEFLPGMRCTFSASPSDASIFAYARTANFSGESGDHVEVAVHMYEKSSMVGRLIGPDGAPLVGREFWASLELENGEQYGPLSGETKRGGAFDISHNPHSSPSAIPATSFKITIYCATPERRPHVWTSETLRAEPGETLDIGEVKMKPFESTPPKD